MAPRIVYLGAVSGVGALVLAILTFFLPIPVAAKAVLYLLFGGLFMVSALLFGRILVMED